MKVADINTGYYVDIFEAHVVGSNALDRFWNPPRKYPLHVLRPTKPCIYNGEAFKCPHDSKAMLDINYDNNIGIPTKYKNIPHPPIYNSILTPPSQPLRIGGQNEFAAIGLVKRVMSGGGKIERVVELPLFSAKSLTVQKNTSSPKLFF